MPTRELAAPSVEKGLQAGQEAGRRVRDNPEPNRACPTLGRCLLRPARGFWEELKH